MTIAERNNKLKHFITCLKCEVSGKCCDDNCSTQYDAGNMGEMIENLEAISKVLEQEPKIGHWIGHREHCENLGVMPSGLGAYEWCSNCDCGIDVREWHRNHYNYCPNCGAKMFEPQEIEDKE